MRRMTFAFYNLAPPAPNRGTERLTVELNALANIKPRRFPRRRPKVVGVCEGVGYRLPDLAGYRKIRSRASVSRANVALYVRDDLDAGGVRWDSLAVMWPRTEHPGSHDPRTMLVVRVEDWTVIVGHAPPAVRGASAARAEWLAAAKLLLKNPGPRLLLSDPNGLGDDLRRGVPGAVTGGTAIEAAHANHATIDQLATPGEVNGVTMLSDHKRALLGRAVRR